MSRALRAQIRTARAAVAVALVLTSVVALGTDPAAGYNDDGLRFEIAGGPGAGEYPAEEFYWTVPVWSQPDGVVGGPVVYGGYGCPADRDEIPGPEVLGPLDGGERTIVVFQRGPANDPGHPGSACTFGEKVESGQKAGFDVVVIANNHDGAGAGANPNAHYCAPPGYGFNPTVIGFCIGHRAFHLLFETTPDYRVPYPAGDPGDVEPDPGELGGRVRATSLGQPVLASRSALGHGWASYAVLTPGGTVKFPIRLDGEVSPGQIGGWLYSDTDQFLGGTAFSSIRSEVSTYNEVKVEGYEVSLEQVVSRERQGFMSMTVNVTTTGPAMFKILLWAAGRKAATWQHAVRADAPTRVLGAELGSSSFIAMSREFDAPARAELHAHAGGRATALGEYRVDVKDTLTASYIQLSAGVSNSLPWSGVQANLLSLSTPRGDRRCLVYSCGLTEFSGPGRAGPGGYTFRMTGAGAGIAGSDDVLLSGVDGRLPAVPSAVGTIDAVQTGDLLDVSGWAAFSGTPPVSAGTDPGGDTTVAYPSELGYDLREASVGQVDPQSGDLRFMLGLTDIPEPFGLPEAARYRWDFGVRTPKRTTLFQIDAKLTDAAGGSTSLPVIVLRGCTQAGVCTKLADLVGWMDGHQNTVSATVPLTVLAQHVGGDVQGAEIVAARVHEGIASVPAAASLSVDGAGDRLEPARDPYYRIASRRVEVGIVPAGQPAAFTDSAQLGASGAYSATLDVSSLPPGDYEVHVRACFAESCSGSVERIARHA